MASTSSQIASSSSSSSSSPSTTPSKYDVFLNFRGGDTRLNFTDHLYHKLTDKCIHTFRDEEKLENGKSIGPNLLKAIEESTFAIVVFSKDYASSPWCLDELAKIVECMEGTGLTVLPVFYHVNPSDVRWQNGTFAEAFVEHEKQEEAEKVQTWKAALKKVADLSGWDTHNRHETKVIEEIVGQILCTLNLSFSSGLKDCVGIDPRVEKMMNSYLCIALDDVRFIGIWGMGGIGKTTLAQIIFERISNKFEACTFVANIKEKVKKHDLVHVQKELLSNILGESNININDHNGNDVIKRRLGNKRVLIILDDVDQSKQLDALAGERGWFGRGSRIIITTRDERLLIENKIEKGEIYKAKELNNDEALLLFRQNAFKNDPPANNFLEMSKEVLKYANGLPLALKVLGCFLYRRSEAEWKNTLERLEVFPDKSIMETLQISIDGLEEMEKEIFLDIACFFKGKDRDLVASILESFCPIIGIEVLISKSLITISRNKLRMHDLLEDLGQEIVRREFPKQPGKRTRLWHPKDAYDILTRNEGTKVVEGIFLNSPLPKEVHLDAEAFSKMTNLRLLKINNVHLPQGLNYLSNELRVIDWNGYPSNSLPIDFQPDKLVELSMCCSLIKQLQDGILRSDKLILIDLSGSQYLIKTPDFTKVPKLERLILKGCTRLSEVHRSIGVLKRLTLLDLQDCTCLNYLPDRISLESLEVFNLSGCSRLEKFPEIEGNMTNLSMLYLDRTAIKELSLSFECLTGLVLLSLRDCKNLSSLPSVTCSLTSLQILTLSGCSNLDKMPENLGNMECLEELDASKTGLRDVSPSILLLKNLKRLSFHGCKGLPQNLFCCLLPCLTLEPISFSLPDSFSGLSSLESLKLGDCNLLDGAIPNDLKGLSSLKRLDLSENNFTSLPKSICQLPKLKVLSLNNCRRLRSLPKFPLSVLYVHVEGCTLLEPHADQVNVWTLKDIARLANIDISTSYDHVNVISLMCSHSQLLKGRLEEIIYNHIEIFSLTSFQTEIPKWFNIQTTGSSVTIPLEAENVKWMGYAMFVVYEVHEHDPTIDSKEDEKCSFRVYKVYEDPTIDSKDGDHHFVLCFETDQEGPIKPLFLDYSRTPHVGQIGLWVYVPHAWFSRNSDNLDKWRSIEASVHIAGSQRVEVKMLGVRLLYEQEVSEFAEAIPKQIFFGDSYGQHPSVYYQLQTYYELQKLKHNSYGIPSVSFGEEDECSLMDSTTTNIELKLLRSMLSRCYEVKYARNKIYKYIFPRSALALPKRWFEEHFTKMPVNMFLPKNLYDDNNWIGFALYAYFSVREHPIVSGDNPSSETWHNFYCSLYAGDDCIQPLIFFPIIKDIFVESYRFLVFHIPRAFFTPKLNQQISIEVEFGIKGGCPDMELETCGIRVVYEKDLEVSVETIVNCILKSPKVYHQGYYQSIKDQVDSLPSYVHEAESSETFDDEQRRFESWKKIKEDYNAKDASRDSESNVIPELVFDERNSYDRCFPQCEIPEWFNHNRNGTGPLMKIELPPDLYTNNSGWEGIALCASFKILKHPNLIHDNVASLVHDNVGSEQRHGLTCYFRNHEDSTLVIRHFITETMLFKSIWLNQREFIWILYRPRDSDLAKLYKCKTLEALFGTESQDIMVQNCRYGLVYQKNMEEFLGMINQCSTTFPEYSQPTHQSVVDDSTSNKQSRDDEGGTNGTGSFNERLRNILKEGSSAANLSYYGSQSKCLRFLYNHSKEIDPLFIYNNCIPPPFHPSGILEWFSCRSNGPSVTIELPQNLHEDFNWMGFALCASFSVQEYSTEFLNSLGAEIPHHLSCLFETDICNVKVPLHEYRTTKEELKWSRLGGFIWLSYIPYRCLSEWMNQCNRIKASIKSNWPGFTVQKCGLHLVSNQDGLDFRQLIVRCRASFLDNWAYFRSDIEQQDFTELETFYNEIEELNSMDSTIQLKRKLEKRLYEVYLTHIHEFSHQGYIFPQPGIPSWFSHQRNGPSVEIQLPPNLYNDERWKGFAICAVFAFPSDLFGYSDSIISWDYILHLDSNEGCLKPDLRCTEGFVGSHQMNALLFVLHISHKTLPHLLNRWTFIRATLKFNYQGMEAEMCGIRILYKQDLEGFSRTMVDCLFAIPEAKRGGYYQVMVNRVNNLERCGTSEPSVNFSPNLTRSEPSCRQITTPIYPERSSGTGISSKHHEVHKRDLRYFNLEYEIHFCFPPIKVLEYFNHQSNVPLLTIRLPPASEKDSNWMGFALYASFSIHEHDRTTILDNLHSETPRYLFCHLKNSTGGSVKLVYCPTKEDLMLLHLLGGLTWMSYIPRGSAAGDWLNKCNCIEASFLSDFPNLTAKECGFRLVYQHDEEGMKHTVRHCTRMLFDKIEPNCEQITTPGRSSGTSISLEYLEVRKRDLPYFNLEYEVHFCFPPIKVLEYFNHQSNVPLLTIRLPPASEKDSNWMGFALYASFSIHEHDRTTILDNLHSETACHLFWHLKNSTGGSVKLVYCPTKEDLILLHFLGGFTWLSYIPRGSRAGVWLNKCNCIEASILSNFSNLTAKECGFRLVYQHDEVGMKHTIRHCMASLFDKLEPKQITTPIYQEQSSGTRVSFEDQQLKNHEVRMPDFNLHSGYNLCFPPSNVLDWFNHHSNEPSVTIRVPPDFENDSNWIGLALCASFSIPEHERTTIPGNLNPKTARHLFCLLETSFGSVYFHCPAKEDLKLLHLGGIMWLFYIPRGSLPKDWFNQCNHIEASITSDFPNLTVKECGFRLVYQHDQVELNHTIRHCMASLSDKRLMVENRKTNKQNHDDEAAPYGSTSTTFEPRQITTPIYQGGSSGTGVSFENHEVCKRDLPYFNLEYPIHFCSPPIKVLEYFNHQSSVPLLTIRLPPASEKDSNWTGLALYASFSIHEHRTTILDNLHSETARFLFCHLKNSPVSIYKLVYCPTEVDLMLLNLLGGFTWLSYIPRGSSLGDWLNQCNCIEASISSDFPNLTAKECGFRLVYRHGELGMKHTIRHCMASLFDKLGFVIPTHQSVMVENRKNKKKQNRDDEAAPRGSTSTTFEPNSRQITTPINQGQSSGTDICFEDQHPENHEVRKRYMLDLNLHSGYNFCFPPSKVVEWFKHPSNEPSVTIRLPPTSQNDSNWMGLALCASFSIPEHPTTILDNLDSETPCHLFCHLENSVCSLEPVHVYSPTKEDLVLLHLGGIMWLSYIPHRSLPEDWLKQCNRIEASFLSDFPNLTAKECGFRLVFQHDEEEFNHTIRHCMASLSDKWGLAPSGSNSTTFETSVLFSPKLTRSEPNSRQITTPIYQEQSSGTGISFEDQHPENHEVHILDFNLHSGYNLCFPPSKVLDWFNHHGNEPSVTIRVPPDFENDSNWMGLALCASFSIPEHDRTTIPDNLNPETARQLLCLLETSFGSVHFHFHCPTKEDLKLLHLGGIMWLSYIPCGSLPEDWLNQCNQIEASISSEYPNLTVKECGFRLVYQHDQVEFNHTIRHCMASLSADISSRTERLRAPKDPKLKDKGKRIIE